MNKSISFGVPVVVFLFTILSGSASGQMQQQVISPTIVISHSTARPVTITFTTYDLQSVERDPSLVFKKIGYAIGRDCSAPYRISSCIWACRNTRKVRTCHPTLLKALERSWSSRKVSRSMFESKDSGGCLQKEV